MNFAVETTWQDVFLALNGTLMMLITLVFVPAVGYFINKNRVKQNETVEATKQVAITSAILEEKIGTIDSKANTVVKGVIDAKKTAEAAKTAADQLKESINGRMEDLIAAAEARGFSNGRCKGIAEVAKAMGDNDKIPVAAQEVLKSVATASEVTLKKGT